MSRDDELYRLFLSGETKSFDQLMLLYGDSLVLYLNGYLHDWQDAEDLMIETFARIMVKKPAIVTGGFKAYLYKTARNLSYRFLQKQKRIRRFSFEDPGGEIADNSFTETILQQKERNEILYLCLGRIDPLFREALWLVYLEQMSYTQAAAVMKVSRKKIDNLITRGKQQMKTELAKEGITNAHE